MNKIALFAAVFATSMAFGCSSHSDDDHDHSAVSPECQALVNLCHPYDDGKSGVPHDCHELGHSTTATAAQCTAKLAACTAACVGKPDTGTADGSSADSATTDGASDVSTDATAG